MGRRILSTPLLASQTTRHPSAPGRPERRQPGARAAAAGDAAARAGPPAPSLERLLPQASVVLHHGTAPSSPRAEKREQTCRLDAETEVPEGIFEAMLKLGKEARSRGQHVLLPRSRGHTGARLVQQDLVDELRVPSQRRAASASAGPVRPRSMD